MSTLAVVVLNWNGLADTRALLPTLAACRVPQDWRLQVIVVDNGSSDGSAAQLTAEFPEVQVLALPEPRPEPTAPTGARARQTQSVGDILRRALAGGAP